MCLWQTVTFTGGFFVATCHVKNLNSVIPRLKAGRQGFWPWHILQIHKGDASKDQRYLDMTWKPGWGWIRNRGSTFLKSHGKTATESPKNPTEWGVVSLSCSFHCQILSRCLNVWSWHTRTKNDLLFHKHHSPFPTLIILIGWLDNGKTDTTIRVTENPQCRMPCIIGHGTGWTGCCFCFLRMEDILVVNQEGTHIGCIRIWKHFRRTTWI